ncbi:MAG: cytochrome c3 family protein [Gammaproteobacteria bacterium]|nr:cytochrome c3 family protein [Gammaproteobacteria bacterium]
MFKTRTTLAFALVLTLALGQSALAQQYARPDGTTTAAGWSASGAPTLHEAVDEPSFNDGDFINSGNGNTATVVLTLSDVSDPGGANLNDHILRVRCQSSGNGGPERCNVALFQGGSQIFSSGNNSASRGAFATNTFTIPDASTITNYSNLSVHITSDNLGGNESVQVSWVELETPGAATVAPTVTTPTFADVTDTSATLGGNVTNDNGTAVTSRGVEWGTTPGGPYPNSEPEGSGGTGIFTLPVTGLPSSTTIYFRAWADNGASGFSAQNSFTTAAPASPPTVTTNAVTVFGQNSATMGGNVTADGGATVSARGVYWNTASPAEAGSQVQIGSGLGTFSQSVGGLPAGTQIFVKAYATNTAGESLGGEVDFTTLAGLATVATRAVENITATSAGLGGNVTNNGGAPVTERGIVWDITSPPELGATPAVVANGSGTGSFIATIGDLPTGIEVFFRAYAINSEGTAYSAIQSFTPAGPPVVTATPASGVTLNSAVLGGNVSNDGGSPVTQRGIVWNTSSPAETGGTVVPMGTGTGVFSQTVSGLPAATPIFWKAYGTNSVATGYSAEESFSTLSEPTLQASNLNFATIAGRSVRMTWTRGNGEGVIVVMRLQTTGRTDPLDGNDYTANTDFTLAPELPVSSQNFVVYKGPATSVTATGLTMTTNYSVAVYEYAGTGGNVDYLQSLPVEGDVTTTDYAVHNYDWGVDCDDCHNHGTWMERGDGLKAVCETCHTGLGVASAKLEFDNHLAPNKNPGVDFVDCGVCHELHNLSATNTTESFNSITLSTQHNKSFLRANVDKYISSAAPPAFLHTDQPKRVAPHPDGDVAADTPERAVEDGTDTTARGYCQVCHTMTTYHTNNPSTSLSDQCHDGETGNCGPAQTQCGECHQHNNKFIGVGGSVTCVQCHDSIQAARPIITTQFDRLSTHIAGGSAAATQEDCLVCHQQGSHPGGPVTVRDADDGATSFTQPTIGAPPTDPAEGEAFEPHCMSCHEDGLASSLPASGSDQTQASPFTGSGAAPVINEASWTTAAHNRSTAPIMSCVGGCHGSGHGSEQNSLLAPVGGPAQSATDFCYQCHDSDGPASSDIQAQFNTATNYSDTSASGAPVNKKHDLAQVGCADCHSPHADNNANPVADPDTALPLATYAISNSYTDDGHNFTYDAGGNNNPMSPEGGGSVTEPDYIQFCLTCHDGTAPPGVNVPVDMVNMAQAWASEQHGAGEGSTGTRVGKGSLKPPWTATAGNDPSNPYAALNCTTCHGAHGSGSIFNLRESITVAGTQMQVGGSPGSEFDTFSGTTYTLPVNGGTQADHVYGAWCTFCHEMSAHAGVDETTTCTSGHMHGANSF